MHLFSGKYFFCLLKSNSRKAKTLMSQVRLQRPGVDRLLRCPSHLRCLPDLRRRCPGHALVLWIPASCHCSPPAKPCLLLLCPAALGPPAPSIGPSHGPAHPSPHDQVADRRRCGRDMPTRLPGEVSAPHHQARRSTYKDRHAQEALPSVGRPLCWQAPTQDYKHPTVHNTSRRGHSLPWRTPVVWTATVRVLTLTHT